MTFNSFFCFIWFIFGFFIIHEVYPQTKHHCWSYTNRPKNSIDKQKTININELSVYEFKICYATLPEIFPTSFFCIKELCLKQPAPPFWSPPAKCPNEIFTRKFSGRNFGIQSKYRYFRFGSILLQKSTEISVVDDQSIMWNQELSLSWAWKGWIYFINEYQTVCQCLFQVQTGYAELEIHSSHQINTIFKSESGMIVQYLVMYCMAKRSVWISNFQTLWPKPIDI